MKRFILLVAAPVLALALVSCPYVEFTIEVIASPESGPAPLTVLLMVQKFEERGIDTIAWAFGDGTPSLSGPYAEYYHVTHVFQNAGVYLVTCLAVDDGVFTDHKAWATAEITVTGSSGGTLAAVIEGTPLSGCPAGALEVTFTSTVSGGSPPYSYEWDFGDGGDPSAEANPVHLYEFGSCDVVLTVTDDLGDTAVSNTLTVEYCP